MDQCKLVLNVLGDVMTFQEATVLLKKSSAYLNYIVSTGKLIEGVDYRRAGRIMLITKDAVYRLQKGAN